MTPYSRPKLPDFLTLCQTGLLKNHTLLSGTHIYWGCTVTLCAEALVTKP